MKTFAVFVYAASDITHALSAQCMSLRLRPAAMIWYKQLLQDVAPYKRQSCPLYIAGGNPALGACGPA